MKIAVAGGSGFVGRALTDHLGRAGHEVRTLARKPSTPAPPATGIAVDIGDKTATTAALDEVEAAYYLVHSMAAGASFRDLDLRLARSFGEAAAATGVRRIVYVGGLGAKPTSAHLASRHEVGAALGTAGVPVVELRAAVVLGAGSISFEMLRYLTERLPMMVCPRWVKTAIQPVALNDLLAYLQQALEVDPGVYEVGGADASTYRDMIETYAAVRGLRRRRIVDIPWLTPHLSSYWVDLVTPVNRSVSHALIESLVTEVVVTEPAATAAAFSVRPQSSEHAMREALEGQANTIADSLLDRVDGLVDGVHTLTREVEVDPRDEARARDELDRIGGRLSWYGATFGWALRIWLGRLVGERLRTQRAVSTEVGEIVDWWRVVRRAPGELVLASIGWWPGEAWLGYRIADGRVRQVAAFRPRGVPGTLYWFALRPIHALAFALMARRRASPSP